MRLDAGQVRWPSPDDKLYSAFHEKGPRMIQCIFFDVCGNMVDPSKPGSFREITGWEEVRKGGGANKITLRKETGRVVCPGCMATKQATGLDPREQRPML